MPIPSLIQGDRNDQHHGFVLAEEKRWGLTARGIQTKHDWRPGSSRVDDTLRSTAGGDIIDAQA